MVIFWILVGDRIGKKQGYIAIKKKAQTLETRDSELNVIETYKYSPNDISKFQYAPVTSCYVENSLAHTKQCCDQIEGNFNSKTLSNT